MNNGEEDGLSDNMIAFISGANRGIGYEFARQLGTLGWQVIAGYRSEDKSKALLQDAEKKNNIHPFKVDIIDEKMLKDLADFIKNEFGRLDLLINNAAINPSRSIDINNVSLEEINNAFQVDVVGQLLTARHLYELLRKGKNAKLINISSKAGLISVADSSNVPYRIGKAALNMLNKIQAESYRADNIIVIAMTPGWVRTDMGGSSARLAPEESVAGMLKVIENISMNDAGSFIAYDGERIAY